MTTEPSFETKYQLALQELDNASLTWPPRFSLYHLLQRLGYQQRPPYYESFNKNAWMLGSLFLFVSILILPLLYTFIFQKETSWTLVILMGISAGISQAQIYRSAARKHNLSSWESLGKQETISNLKEPNKT